MFVFISFGFTLICCSGYISPEYAVHGRFSIKSDVFSFGVIVLEIVSGKKNREFSHEEHRDNLLGHVSYKTNSKFLDQKLLIYYGNIFFKYLLKYMF